jgi:hypothetical protein
VKSAVLKASAMATVCVATGGTDVGPVTPVVTVAVKKPSLASPEPGDVSP